MIYCSSQYKRRLRCHSGRCTLCLRASPSHAAASFIFFFFFNHTATTEIYTSSHTLSLHDALPISRAGVARGPGSDLAGERAAARARSEEHTSELQSRELISYAVFCLKKKKKK